MAVSRTELTVNSHVLIAPPRSWLRGLMALTGLFLCGFLAFGIGAYSFTQFLEPLAAEFHWGRATLGGLMSAFWLSAPFAPVSAYLLDRVGVRALVLIGGAIETLGLAGMMLATDSREFYLLRFCMGVGKVLTVTPLPVMAAKWFTRRPGVAIAVSLCGWHVGGLIMAPLSEELIAAGGWRRALMILSGIMALGFAAAVAMLSDPNKRAEGSTPAHEPLQASSASVPRSGPARTYRLGPLIGVGCGTLAFYAGYAGLLGQLSPLLTDSGFDARTVGELTGSVAICAAVCVLIAGGVTQWVSAKVSGTVILALMGVTAFDAMTLAPLAGQWHALSVVILLGALVGGGDPIVIETLRRCVAPSYFGRAYGWWYLLCLAALTVAPFAVGAAFDHTGNYQLAFLSIGAAAFAAAVIWAWSVKEQTP
jgi:MFS transporter, OFA family, oxalate/formate antiporter